ncbi:RASD family member 3 [Hypomesus transpacificus]|uniref:RASD family member 3 n=1 Tax=Hypomesus transpacificus TaxID=137520 RepID=UPI001F0787A2|nr:RASD family member 3 [Hypomesus transpacificus]
MSLAVCGSSTVRLVFLGAAGVGKTSLILRFLHDRFEHKYTRTVEELHALEYDTGAGKVRLEILDTSGSYSFPAMRELCIRHSDAFVLVYAVDDPGSLEEVRRLREEILELKGGKCSTPITVVGNKADLMECDGRVLPTAEIMAMVELEWNASFVEASARTGENAVELFRALLQQVNLPSRLSPALRRRRETVPRESPKKRPPLKKNNSCILC